MGWINTDVFLLVSFDCELLKCGECDLTSYVYDFLVLQFDSYSSSMLSKFKRVELSVSTM